MKLTEIEAAIEAILFISGKEVELSKLAYAINQSAATTKKAIESLKQKYIDDNRGIQIVQIANSYQFCTSPKYFEFVDKLYSHHKNQNLTTSLLETLAIIVYNQPITKSQIEEIRGVNADHAINKLLERNLICEVGRLETPGKPMLFGTTNEFLRYFGFTSRQLPHA